MLNNKLERLEQAWKRTDAIFDMVRQDALYSRPIPLRQPIVFYLGHLPAFCWNQLCRGVLGMASFEPAFDSLFERGIDPPVDGYVPQETDWPELERIVAYRDRAREEVRSAVAKLELMDNADPLVENGRILSVLLEHETMHHETLLYILQQLPLESLVRPSQVDYIFAPIAESGMREVAGGKVRLGVDFGEVEFGWDNEFGRLEVQVEPFEVATLPVTNGEYLEFVEAGGYSDSRWWPERYLDWLKGLSHPLCWQKRGSQWLYRSLFDTFALEEVAAWPVYVSLAEAEAYARFRGARLMTEAEYKAIARDGVGNYGFRHWSPVPAGYYGSGEVRDLVGNGWEWTSTLFEPFEGFKPYIRTYLGYSRDFFDNNHYVLLGASWATDEGLVRPSFRNWFQPNYRYVFAKFRLARSL